MITIILRDSRTLRTIASVQAEDHSTKLARSNMAVRKAEDLGLDKYAQYDIEVLEKRGMDTIDKYELRPYRY